MTTSYCDRKSARREIASGRFDLLVVKRRSAVDLESLPSDKTAILRSKKQTGLTHLFDISHPFSHLILLSSQSRNLILTVLKSTFKAIDLFLADINLVLVSADLEFGLLVHFLLRGDEFIHLLAHFFNLLSLSVIYVGLAGSLIMAFPDLVLSVLILTAQLLI
jgi:uncharacterized membrane protein